MKRTREGDPAWGLNVARLNEATMEGSTSASAGVAHESADNDAMTEAAVTTALLVAAVVGVVFIVVVVVVVVVATAAAASSAAVSAVLMAALGRCVLLEVRRFRSINFSDNEDEVEPRGEPGRIECRPPVARKATAAPMMECTTLAGKRKQVDAAM